MKPDETALDITAAQGNLLRSLLQQHLPNTTVWGLWFKSEWSGAFGIRS